MSKAHTTKKVAQTCKSENNLWDEAIADAEKMIQDAKKKISHLKQSVVSFKYLRDEGEPFPLKKQPRKEANL